MAINIGNSAVIHTLPECPWCYRAKALMDHINLDYTEIKEKHPDWPTVPYITIDGEVIGGFSELAKLITASV